MRNGEGERERERGRFHQENKHLSRDSGFGILLRFVLYVNTNVSKDTFFLHLEDETG